MFASLTYTLLAFLSWSTPITALFQPHAISLPHRPLNPSDPETDILRPVIGDKQNYGLFDRPVPVQAETDVDASTSLDNNDENELDLNKRSPQAPELPEGASFVSEAVPSDLLTAYANPPTGNPGSTAATATATPTAGGNGDYGDYGGNPDVTGTYLGPGGLPTFDPGLLSSLSALDASLNAEASSLLSSYPSGVDVECSGIEEVGGGTVTVCGPTGGASATSKSDGGRIVLGFGGGDERGTRFGMLVWGVFVALGSVGMGVAFFL
jgi:hypothetical protein